MDPLKRRIILARWFPFTPAGWALLIMAVALAGVAIDVLSKGIGRLW